MSESLTLSFPSWIWAELNVLTTRDWPTSRWGSLASSPRFWNCSELGMHTWRLSCKGCRGEGAAFPWGPQQSLTPPSSCEGSSSPTSGCLPGALCLGHTWVVTVARSRTPPNSLRVLRAALLCPLLGASSPSPRELRRELGAPLAQTCPFTGGETEAGRKEGIAAGTRSWASHSLLWTLPLPHHASFTSTFLSLSSMP